MSPLPANGQLGHIDKLLDRQCDAVTVALLTWIAIVAGAAAASAALYGHYRVLPALLTGPEICQLENGGCTVLFRSPRSRLLGVPNAALGIALYALLVVGLIAGFPPLLLFIMTIPAIVMSAFLGYSLIANGHQCRICWTGHAANLTLAIIFALRTGQAMGS